MEPNELLAKIKHLTEGYKGEDEPQKRILWLEQLLKAYQRYLPSRIVERIKIDPAAKKVQGERRTITVTFADLSGFTSLSETMDAEDIAAIINDFFTRMLKIVFKYEGSVDKFLGDALMVIFGAPVAHHDDPERAVRAALEMQQEMTKFNEEREFTEPLAMSIGINTGPAVALNVGSEDRMEYTVIGDTVNLSARLEKVAQAGEIIISDNTYKHIADVVECEKRTPVKVKGKKKPVHIYLAKGMQEHYRLPDVTKLELVGRTEEVKTIEATLDRVEKRIGTLLGINGEPGAGKTRLGIETVLLAEKRHFVTLNARCMLYDMNTAYAAFTKILNDYFNILPSTSEEQKKLLISMKLKNLGLELDATLPYIGVLYGIQFPQLQGIPPNELKKRIFSIVRQVLFAEAAKQPVLLRIEDLQWCDPTSIELCEFLLEGLRETPILMACEYRSDYAFPWLSYPDFTNIALKNFSKQEVNDYIHKVLDITDIEAELADIVVEKSQGNPLFVQEIVKFLIKRGAVRRYKGKAIITKRMKDIEIAESISGVILAQIDRMSEMQRHVLQHASVIGKLFNPGLLSRVMNMPMDNLRPDLERLEHFEGVLVSHKRGSEIAYEFLSPTTYEVTYGSLLKTRRKELHTVIANIIEQDHSDNVPEVFERLAYHFSRSINKGKGVHFSKLAAEKSYHLYALKESVNFFQQTVDLIGKKDLTHDELRTQLEVLRRQGFVLKILGELETALRNQKRSLRLAMRLESPEDEARASNNIAILYYDMGVPQKGLNYWLRARRVAKKAGNTQIQIEAVNCLGNYYLVINELDKATGYFNEVIDLSEQIHDQRMNAFAHRNLGGVALKRGDIQGALKEYQDALSAFETLGEKESISQCLNDIGMLNLQLGNFEIAMQKLNEAVVLATEIGHKEVEAFAHANIGFAFAQMWQLDKAHEKFSQSLTLSQMIGNIRQAMGMSINIGDIHLYRGNLGAALEYHNKSFELAEQIKDTVSIALANRSIGWDNYYIGDYNKALQSFSKSQEIFQSCGDRRNGVLSMLGIAATRSQTGHYDEILTMLQGFEVKAREINDLEILTHVLDIKTSCLMGKGDYAAAKKTIEELPDLCRKIGNKRLYAWVLGKRAYIAANENDDTALQENLNKSKGLAGEIGDGILFMYNSITNTLAMIHQENYTESLNILMKTTEQARTSGAQEYLAKTLWLTAQVFKKIGKEQEYGNYLTEYGKVKESLTKTIPDNEIQLYLNTLEMNF